MLPRKLLVCKLFPFVVEIASPLLVWRAVVMFQPLKSRSNHFAQCTMLSGWKVAIIKRNIIYENKWPQTIEIEWEKNSKHDHNHEPISVCQSTFCRCHSLFSAHSTHSECTKSAHRFPTASGQNCVTFFVDLVGASICEMISQQTYTQSALLRCQSKPLFSNCIAKERKKEILTIPSNSKSIHKWKMMGQIAIYSKRFNVKIFDDEEEDDEQMKSNSIVSYTMPFFIKPMCLSGICITHV